MLKLLTAGLYTLIVDYGRPGWRSLGVPLGGAADRWSYTLGNALVGNPPGAAALEISLSGPTLRATAAIACVVCGAPFELSSSQQLVTMGKTFTMQPGEELHIGGTDVGMRAYLCVAGGLHVPQVLGSRSGLAPLSAGSELPCRSGSIEARFLQLDAEMTGELTTLRVLPGGHADWFNEADFYNTVYQASSDSNRMGLRLRGRSLALPARELVSEPVCPGTVQVTRDGQCIMLGVDGQTIGGYPRIAQVIGADLDQLGQLRPGQPVRFARVHLDEAERLYRQRRAHQRRCLLPLVTTPPGSSLFPHNPAT